MSYVYVIWQLSAQTGRVSLDLESSLTVTLVTRTMQCISCSSQRSLCHTSPASVYSFGAKMDLIPDQHEGAWYRVCVGLVYMIQCGYRDALYMSFDQTQLGSEIKNMFFLCCKKQALLSFMDWNIVLNGANNWSQASILRRVPRTTQSRSWFFLPP